MQPLPPGDLSAAWLLDTLPWGILVVGADGVVHGLNQQAARWWGLPQPAVLGQALATLLPTHLPIALYDALHALVAGAPPLMAEFFLPHTRQWITQTSARQAGQLVVYWQDITARKTAEQGRSQTLRLLEQAESVAGMGSWEYELATGRFTWSDGLYQLFGLPLRSQVTPRTYLNLVLAEDQPLAERLVRQLAAGTSQVEETLRIRVASQVKTLRFKAVQLADDQASSRGLLGVVIDLSEVQRLEQENLHLRLTQQQVRVAAVLEAQEEERRRLAERLHNGLGQLLFATKLQLAAMPTLATARGEVTRLLTEAIRQARTLSHELTPSLVTEFGLATALREHCRTLSSPTLQWQCLVFLEQELTLPLQVAVYRLAQELTLNVVKYAQATQASLEVDTLPGWVGLRVEDNGRGFEPAAPTTGIGLQTLRHRVALLGGTVQLDSLPKQGTYVQVRLPLSTTAGGAQE